MDGLSLKPSDATTGSFLDDADVTLGELRFVIWDYQGKSKPTVALKVLMTEEGDERTHEQYYSAGDPEKLVPSEDGKTLVPRQGATGLNQNTNALAFIASLVNAGFPEDRIGNDISVFDGMGVHVNQVAQPKRAGLKDQKEGKTYLLVTKINRLPWEAAPKPVAKGAPAAAKKTAAPVVTHPSAPAPAAAPAASNGSGDDTVLVEKARATVVAILAEKGGSIPKGKLPTEIFRVLSNDGDRNAIVTLVYKEAFLQAAKAEGAFAYDGSTVSLG